MTIVEFLEARIAEDEDVAKASIAQGSSGRLEARGKPGQPGDLHDAQFHGPVAWNREESAFDNYEDAAHAARHDPERALHEVAAKRKLIEKFGDTDLGAPYNESPEAEYWEDWQVACYDVLITLASIYSEHPDYRKEWELKIPNV